jgi:hypothetical protein
VHDSTMTIDKCLCLCSGFNYAGLEAGNQCFCSNISSGGSDILAAYCSTSCQGDSSQICGGSWALSVYKVPSSSSPSLVPTPSELPKETVTGIVMGSVGGSLVIGGGAYCVSCKLGLIRPARCLSFCL